jgi:membrane associated rhomboid family serine protease
VFPVKDNIPNRRFPVVTALLILINVVAYLLAIRHGGSLVSGPDLHEIEKYGAIPYALTHSGAHHVAGTRIATWETVFTAMFMHASILHIAGNMLFLWIFGNNVEDALGPVKFVLFYLLAGTAALALQVATDPNSMAPTLGASGAIAGVLGAYIVLYPRAQVLTVVFIVLFVTVVELPAWLMLGVWFAEQAVFAATNLTTPAGGGNAVAYFAHIGGFAFGLVVGKLAAVRLRPRLRAA